MAHEAEEDDGATISETGLAECTTIAQDRKSWRKLLCRSNVSDLQQRRWNKDDNGDVMACML